MENNERQTALGEMRLRIMEIIAGLSGTDIDPELAYGTLADFHNADPHFIREAHKALTTGTGTGRKMAADFFATKIKKSKTPDFFYTTMEAVTVRELLTQTWCFGNVAEAVEHTDPAALLRNSKVALRLMEMYRVPHFEADRDEAYWNGLAALMIIVHPEDDEDAMLDAGGAFILWAGSRTDLKDVVRIGGDRKIITPSVIEEIMAEEAQVAVAIRNGVL